MKIIFCISNLFVPSSLSIISESDQEPIILYTNQEGIYQLIKKLALSNVIPFYHPEFHLKKNPAAIINYFKKRKAIYNKLTSFPISKVYFFHNSFGGLENWLIRKLSSTCEIYHIPTFNNLIGKKKYAFKAFKGLFISFLINKAQVVPLWTGDIFIFKLSKSYFSDVCAQNLKIPINHTFLKKIVNDSFQIQEKSIILLTGTIVELNHVQKEEYITKIDCLIKELGPEKISIKAHPRFSKECYGLENNLVKIPSYVPANILFSNFNIYIGYSTSVLAEASNEGKIAISLLDLLNPIKEERKKWHKEYLKKNVEKGKIFFPRDISELSSIILKKGICRPYEN
ncbi:MAG: hypothetical protein O2U61_00700 [Candidatus Bathyarchaeota archaeon]|nr:hypothetical protein [Candidatus Bathyarchaeota archaeon]